MALLTHQSPPVVAPNPKAVELSQVVLALPVDGKTEVYQGEALQWDVSKAPTIALVFTGPWYGRRTANLFLWATAADTTLQVTSTSLSSPVTVNLVPTQGAASRNLELAIEQPPGKLSDEVRIFLTCEGDTPGTSIFIALDGGPAHMGTRLETQAVPNLPLAMLVASWSLVFAALFAIGVLSGSKGALFAAPALAVVPGILNLLGVSWAKMFNLSLLARGLANSLPRWAGIAWSMAGAPAAVLMSYVAFALLVYAAYDHRLDTQGLAEEATLKQVASLFCDYPERHEVRALTARKLFALNRVSRSVNAELELIKEIPTERFLNDCLAGPRVTPLFFAMDAGQHERALIFYAGVWWASVDRVKDLDVVMREIRRVLTSPGASSALSELTLAKFEARSIKNQNEHNFCKGDKAGTEDCTLRRRNCAVARAKLEAKIERITEPADVRTITYLEARDVAASSHMSTGCAAEGPDDAKKAVDHLKALVRNTPREAVLDDFLLQLNFRKFLDAQFEKRPDHQTSLEWQAECRTYRPDVCALLIETFINDQKQTFFVSDREKRAADWETPSIPALKGPALEQAVERLKKKDWKWPLS